MKLALSTLKVVPESIVISCASKFGPEEDNQFKQCINDATIYRTAGLTPIYLCNDSFNNLFVTSKETLRKQYN